MLFPEVLQTKITPSKVSSRIIYRKRVLKKLLAAKQSRLSILQASAGYGKSTSLAMVAEREENVIWYQITKDDSNLPIFLLYLLHATQRTFPQIKNLPLPTLKSWDSTQGALPSKNIIHQYLNAVSKQLPNPTILILDDIHLILDAAEIAHTLDRLISLAPPNLHILLSSRYPVKLPNLYRWLSHGEVLKLDQQMLAFTPKEVADLYIKQYQYELMPEEIKALTSTTEGWAIALQLIWQGLRSGAVSSIEDALTYQASTMENLFAILTHEVLEQQPEDIQKFLEVTAPLRTMTPEACDALREKNDSAAILAYLQRQDLFIVDAGNNTLRYQHIFHHLLQQQTKKEERRHWHIRAAKYYTNQSDIESAIYHTIQAEEHNQAAKLLAKYGEELLEAGRLDTLGSYLETLPPEKLLEYPFLLKYMGDLARLRNQFQEALGWYQQAENLWREKGQTVEVGRALRGQARVYLDTVNPSRAAELLQQALKISDGIADRKANARLYELLAENKLNAGKLEEAENFRREASAFLREGPSESQLLYRVLLRTGRLKEAQNKLENRAKTEADTPVKRPRAHRETQLLLSLIYAFQGKAQLSYQTASDGIQRGAELTSPFVTAVGHMRQGHALMLLQGENRYDQARAEYEKAIDISRSLSTPRLRVEAYWGLCRVYGYQGDLEHATQIADKAIKIASKAGDEWIVSLIRLTIGASLIQAKRYEAAHTWLQETLRGFQECSDPFGSTAARLWHCLGWFHQENTERLSQEVPRILGDCQENQYGFLFTQPTLLGQPDERSCIPLLIQAREQGWGGSYPQQLLKEMGLPKITLHAGYQLLIYTLGKFQVCRGKVPISRSGWQRTKSRHLFQLLVTFRDSSLDREQIYEYLWPSMPLQKAERNFKVALSTLYRVLEPDRTPGSDSAYIARENSRYLLRPEADSWLDVQEFTQIVKQVQKQPSQPAEQTIRSLEKALQLYRGEYLPEARYETWASAEREHLSVLYLRTADHLCELYLREKLPEQAINLCQHILAEDNCWERAYRHMMMAYNQIGDHGQIARTYQRCVHTLQNELEISPAPETKSLYQELIVA